MRSLDEQSSEDGREEAWRKPFLLEIKAGEAAEAVVDNDEVHEAVEELENPLEHENGRLM